ncbi:DUF4229 domain-containing protein [Arthrobacter sp. B10-11]|uniref:DUF4229 domain-containing protein n=1 Tax=Arthrobacter sp. B10-11 TaxID=3081160 RepID=UPI002954110D|nr:DUF4229 domain-containing protein [Arthrobacter sp. B10-11]MDV8147074.1 DUF4229 domain-containing protein [Arthrobacter sp. B10-11]
MKYTLIRLALFVPLFALFSFLQIGMLLSAVCAGLIAFAISYLFFQKQRDAATATLHERFSGRAKPIRTAGEVEDADAEDSLVDANPDITVRSEVPRTDAPRTDAPRKES